MVADKYILPRRALIKLNKTTVAPITIMLKSQNILSSPGLCRLKKPGTTTKQYFKKADGSTNRGAFGRSIRTLPDDEFDRIWQAGFGQVIDEKTFSESVKFPQTLPPLPVSGFAERQSPFMLDEPMEQERRIVEATISRPFRDKAFAVSVKRAYGDTCAMTGLKIINGGGRSEVQAAHIRPVEQRGPDSVRNGLALSGTMHWMFDRGLISVDEDWRLLLADSRLPDTVERLLTADRRLLLPVQPHLRPHPKFLEFHRREIFKG